MSKIFIDTNILIYSIDTSENKKLKSARTLLKKSLQTGSAVISTQIMQEFYVTCIKKLKVKPQIAKKMLAILQNFEVIQVDEEIINEAIDISIINEISFWDALIISAASSANCEELWTEDLNSGQKINGIKILNPFKE